MPVFSLLCEERVRARRRDDLRGLPPPLRPPAALRPGRRRHGAAPRRLPLRPRPRADRGDRQRRGGARSRRADLALRPGPGRRPRRRGGGVGRDRGAPRPGCARARRGRSCGSAATRRPSPSWPGPPPAPMRSSAHVARTTSGWGKVTPTMLASLWFVADAAEEGRKVVLSMLVVGLIFVARDRARRADALPRARSARRAPRAARCSARQRRGVRLQPDPGSAVDRCTGLTRPVARRALD